MYRKHDHIYPLLSDLHWLRVPQWIKFKLAVLVCTVQRHPTSRMNCVAWQTYQHNSVCDLRRRRHSMFYHG